MDRPPRQSAVPEARAEGEAEWTPRSDLRAGRLRSVPTTVLELEASPPDPLERVQRMRGAGSVAGRPPPPPVAPDAEAAEGRGGQQALRRLLHAHQTLRLAMLLNEVLGPPRGLR